MTTETKPTAQTALMDLFREVSAMRDESESLAACHPEGASSGDYWAGSRNAFRRVLELIDKRAGEAGDHQ